MNWLSTLLQTFTFSWNIIELFHMFGCALFVFKLNSKLKRASSQTK